MKRNDLAELILLEYRGQRVRVVQVTFGPEPLTARIHTSCGRTFRMVGLFATLLSKAQEAI